MIYKQLDKLFTIHETYNPYKIAKERKIDIIEMPLGEETYGLTVRNNRFSTFIIDDSIHENTKEFVLCHELGHSVLHKQANTPFMRSVGAPSQILKMEAEANTFAFELLRRHYDELNYMTPEQIVEYFELPNYMKNYI